MARKSFTLVKVGPVISRSSRAAKKPVELLSARDAAASAARRSQVRTVDRSERIRTYNFPENRISDHRIGFKAYNLDAVLNGDLQALITALQDADTQLRLSQLVEQAS